MKKQETVIHNEEKKELILTNLEMTQMLKDTDKNFGAAVINMFKGF